MPHEGANLTEEKIMELKNCKIGIQLDDAQLQLHLAELLMRKGAFVYTARNDEEMELLLDGLDLDMAIVGVPAESGPAIEAFGVN